MPSSNNSKKAMDNNKYNYEGLNSKKNEGNARRVIQSSSRRDRGGPTLFPVEPPPVRPSPPGRTQTLRTTQVTKVQDKPSKKARLEMFPEDSPTLRRELDPNNTSKSYNRGSGRQIKNDKSDKSLSHAATIPGLVPHPQRSQTSESSRQTSSNSLTPGAVRVNQDGIEPPEHFDDWGTTTANAPGIAYNHNRMNPRIPSGADDDNNAPVERVSQDNDKSMTRLGRRAWCVIGAVILIAVAVGISVSLSSRNKSNDEDKIDVAIFPKQELAPSPSPTKSFGPTISGSEWAKLGQDLGGLEVNDQFGQQVSVSGDGRTLAAASIQYGTRSAYIRFFRLQDETQQWSQVGDTFLQGAASTLELSFDGSRMIVGTVHRIHPIKVLGTVEVFELDNTTMSFTRLGNSLIGSTISFGDSVAISGDGNIIAIGDYNKLFQDGNEAQGRPADVTVFRWDKEAAAWRQLGEIIFGRMQGDLISSVSLSFNGSVVAIGATGADRGYVQVLQLEADSAWINRGADLDSSISLGQNFGWKVDLNDDGSVLAVGDPTSRGTGAVSIFRYGGTNWYLQGDVIESAITAQFGFSIKLSSDGSIVAIGAPPPRVALANDNGRASVFRLVRDSWVLLGRPLEGEANDGSRFGWSLGMSGDGRVVAVGDIFNYDLSGSVRIFELG